MKEVIETSRKKDELTCIQLSKDTKAKLDKLGIKSDTYESIILNLMDSTCVKKQDENQEENSDE